MKRMRENFLVYHVLSSILVLNNSAIGQELPNLKKVTIKSEVTLTDGIYSYSYTAINDTGNIGDIYRIELDISKPESGIELSGEGLINGPGFLKHTSSQVLSESTTPKMIPVGLSSPLHWIAGLGVNGTVGWGGSDTAPFLPGQSLSGFLITSHGLPGIRVFRVDPFVDVDTLPDDVLPPDDVEAAKQLVEKLAFHGKTLGPTAPPRYMDYKAFLETIRGYINESVTLGWLIDPSLTNTLKTYLDTAAAYIDANDPTQAKTALQEFMITIEQASSAQRTSEAQGLLYFNAKYLKDTLPDTYIPPE